MKTSFFIVIATVAGLVGILSFTAQSFNGFIGSNAVMTQVNMDGMETEDEKAIPKDDTPVDEIGQQDPGNTPPPPDTPPDPNDQPNTGGGPGSLPQGAD
jgi:hypothetical protein